MDLLPRRTGACPGQLSSGGRVECSAVAPVGVRGRGTARPEGGRLPMPPLAIDIGRPQKRPSHDAGHNARLFEGKRVVKPSRAAYRLPLLSLLLSMAMLLQPTIAQAAEGDTTTTVAIPRADTSSQTEPSSNAPVVLRGARAVTPAAAQEPNVNNRAPPP